MNGGLRNGTVDGRSLPGVLYAVTAWKARRWTTANPPFLHADTCGGSDVEGHHPWVALHHILDNSRG